MANPSLNPASQNFHQLMGNGLSYRVPPFQRDYSWDGDDWEDLWQDIIGLFSDDPEPVHYMGYLVLQTKGNRQFDIIDGQQRIATLSIMILAAISCLNDLSEGDDSKNAKRAEQLRNSYIGFLDPVSLVPKSKIQLNRRNDSFYQTYLVPLANIPQRRISVSEQLMRKSFDWFKKQISQRVEGDGEQVAVFINDVVDKLIFTVITVTDELNAFKVFETLNARGVRLSSTDLLKNHLFSVVYKDGAHETELEALEKQWEGIVGALGSEKLPDFLRAYWNSRNKLVRKANLFKAIKRKISTKRDAFALIRDLDANAGVYRALRNPSDSHWNDKESRHVGELQMFGVRQPISLLLAAFAYFGKKDRVSFYKILRAVSIISFRYNVICSFQANEQEQAYNTVAIQISSGKLKKIQDFIKTLKPVYLNDEVFSANFQKRSFRTADSRNKRIVRYILFELERRIKKHAYDFEDATTSIEHIMPENPQNGWRHIDESDYDNFVYRLGNMTLLDQKHNKTIGNAEYSKKIRVYKESEFALTRKITTDYDEWNLEKIDALQNWMTKQAKSIWKINF